ncbi:putative LPS assembly protein LptD [Gracilimonas amylolytica]|uniref:putative LPS assembly protein LptD n=1 Tax=Gracilimonas amylolytica TaxID=1749045 RepID=UPI000CD87FB8|nr:putative LPS assembly protein LptD [Gracilimonas amylolytica]
MATPAKAQQSDSTAVRQDTTLQQNQSEPPGGSVISNVPDNAVRFQSSDSLVIDFKGGKKAFLFGSANVKHSAGELKAGEINMDIDNTTVEARTLTPEDTLSRPVLVRESDEIKSTRILFNYKTQKGKFEAAQVKVSEGHLIGSKIKNVNESEVFIEDGIYSTCPPEYMYYYLKAKKMKVVDEDELFFSNAQLYILDIPYPIIFPFGYVPTDLEKQRSGLLTPTYAFQDQNDRGLGLQNVGWFQYFNDHLTGQVDGDIYTSGSFYLNGLMQYRRTDQYNGSIRLGYSNDRGMEPTDPDFSETIQRSVSVQHSQTISPYASLSANVNLRTADFNRRNSYDIDDRAEVNSNSKISYNYRHPENLYSFSTNAQLVQNFTNYSTRVSGPSANFRLKNISPFQNNSGGGDQDWYETISLSYSNNLRSQFNFDPIDADSSDITFFEALTDKDKYEEATGNDRYIQAGLQHQAGIQVGQIIPSQFLNISTGINYTENWYPSSIRKSFNADSNRVETEKVYGFTASREFSTNLNFGTTFYGVSDMKLGNFQGLRHTVRPSLSFSYRPDFSAERWGYYKTVQTDSLGATQEYSIFEDAVFGGPGRGESRSLNFSLQNVFETKRVKRDSTGEVSEKNIRFIDNLSLNTSYNFAADSLNLSDLRTRISSSAINGLNLSATANFSFYQFDSTGRELDRFFIEDSKKLAQLRSFSLNASTSFRGGDGVQVYTPEYRRRYDPFDQSTFHPIDTRFGYEPVPPLNSPWSVSLNFSYSWTYRFNDEPTKRATLRASSISFNLTPKWRFNTDVGYDFVGKEFTPSQFSLNRDLECWNLSFQINPFGEFKYYFFRLSVNSSQIQSLFQKLPVLKNLERSSSPSGARGRGYGGF